ncbi:uncharacterized protein BCR38DRAFT_456225 [Pseudomassariella vexata]|uniref:SET domain-containing protein n=1 Tax=Pseudomassariella vexata TaxID=1141098 RepID=A0A1Y2E851_9PEZI|nr:uncharacterized protein BCR38DRAFT_456225 [Pseudomassariella vexata]ORY67456.1 hypothetical protein BCR38DRAFT_456225 [Pseudomassariella vexata]
MATMSPARASSAESSFGGAADTFSNVASLSSTPPTTVADSMSLASDASKPEHVVASDPIEETVSETLHQTLQESIRQQQQQPPPPPPTPTQAAPELMQMNNVELVVEAIEVTTAVSAPAEAAEAAETPATPNATSPADAPSSTGRPRRSRASLPVYNLAQLTGTAIHGKRRSKGDVVSERRRRRTIAGDTWADNNEDGGASPDGVAKSAGGTAGDRINALDSQRSMRGASTPNSKVSKKRALSPEPRRISTRSTGTPVENLANKLTTLGKRGRKSVDKGLSRVALEIKRLQDTNEFAGIDTKPVLYTTWAKGKLVTHTDPEPATKKRKVPESPKKAAPTKAETPVEEAPPMKQRRIKKWLEHGLYSGQEAPMDIYKSLTPTERKSLADMPELMPSGKPNGTLPQPIFNGLRLLIRGRDFKLPYDICNPLPPGQPKPDEWRKMTRNRFVGNASAIWKKNPHFNDYQSKCVCTPEDGCAESCQNRIMLYECDQTNCNVGPAHCQNRAFARLQERTKAGGKYRVGVEVIKTEDRGYGIRSNRCFEPNQIIMEYTGEIITEEECDRRMNEKYKENQCYYLMSFDQNMIIDATTGSIARFVNHSCTPNCRMIKWIVSGQPRMALFAGDRAIMTGEELTYDYNFDPFSAKNVQKCLCGSANCRGVLGPKSKEVKPPKAPKEDLKKSIKAGVKAGKRKLKELIRDKGDDEDGTAAKRRKIKKATGAAAGKGLTRALSTASLKAAKNAAKVVKRSVSTISVNAKATLGSKSPKLPASGRKLASIKRKSTVVKTYSKKISMTPKKAATSPPKQLSSRKSSLTIVAASTARPGKGSSPSVKSTPSTKEAKDAPTSRGRGRPRKHAIASPASGPTPRKALDIARPSHDIRIVESPTA